MDILGMIGVSTLIAIVVSFVFDTIKSRMELKHQKLFSEKEERYRSILVFMSVLLDVRNLQHINSSFKPDYEDEKSIQRYYRTELELQLSFSKLYTNENVTESISHFLSYPTKETFEKTATAMRKDLWGK